MFQLGVTSPSGLRKDESMKTGLIHQLFKYEGQ